MCIKHKEIKGINPPNVVFKLIYNTDFTKQSSSPINALLNKPMEIYYTILDKINTL